MSGISLALQVSIMFCLQQNTTSPFCLDCAVMYFCCLAVQKCYYAMFGWAKITPSSKWNMPGSKLWFPPGGWFTYFKSKQQKLISSVHTPSLTADPSVIDLPPAAAHRLTQETLPAESRQARPNVGCGLWPALRNDWRLSEANNNAGYCGKPELFDLIYWVYKPQFQWSWEFVKNTN